MKPVRHRHRGYGRTGATSWDVRKRPNGAECLCPPPGGRISPHIGENILFRTHPDIRTHPRLHPSPHPHPHPHPRPHPHPSTHYFSRFDQLRGWRRLFGNGQTELTYPNLPKSNSLSSERTSLNLLLHLRVITKHLSLHTRRLCLPLWPL